MKLLIAFLTLLICVADAQATDCQVNARKGEARLSSDWRLVGGTIWLNDTPTALKFQCIEGDPLYAYVQAAIPATDTHKLHASVAELARDVGGLKANAVVVSRCIDDAKADDDTEHWTPVGAFGNRFQCSKDADTQYFRVKVAP